MFDLKVLIIAVGAALAIGLGAGGYAAWQVRSTQADLELLDLRKTYDDATAAAAAQARQREQSMQLQINDLGKKARDEQKQIGDNFLAAGDSTTGLLTAASNRLSAAACDPGVARRGQAATSAAFLYSQLLGESQQLAKGLAREADSARARGASCEVAYDLMRKGLKGIAEGPAVAGG